MNTLETLYYLCEVTSKKLDMMAEKFRKNGDEIPNNDVALFNELTHSLKSIKTSIAMMEAEEESGYSSRSYSNHYMGPYYSKNEDSSYRHRNSMGRHSRSDGLHEMLDNLNEEKRMKVQRYIEDMERM